MIRALRVAAVHLRDVGNEIVAADAGAVVSELYAGRAAAVAARQLGLQDCGRL